MRIPKLKEAGAIILAKVNLGELAMSPTTGSALGGLLTGVMFDASGSYRLPFSLAIGFMLAAMWLTTRVRESPPAPR